MAVTQNTYTGDGSTVLFSFTFPYLETTDIKVSLNGTVTTAYTLANATTVQFNTAPANGAAIRIYRETDDSGLNATFYPGSAIRSSDLNDNFTQNLYVTQESSNNAATATSTANSALTTANTAISTANSAVTTANTAASDAAAAVSTANTASSDASAAVSTANTASADAASAVTTANAASTTANDAAADAATALSTANTASTNASAAVTTANAAAQDASDAVTTANDAASDATTAVNTANNALNAANNAQSTANTADANANAALNAIAGTVQYVLVANVAAIPGSPSNGDAIEIADSTGLESFSPLTNRPAGFVGDSGLSVRLQYLTANSSWNWLNYFPNNAETRYLKFAGGTITGNLEIGNTGSLTFEGSTANTFETTVAVTDPTADRTITLPDQSGTVLLTGSTVSAADGTASAPGITFSSDTNTGLYSPGADQLALSTNGTGRLFIDASGNVGVGVATPSARLHSFLSDNSRSWTPVAATSALFERNAVNYVTIEASSASSSALTFADEDSQLIGGIYYNHAADYLHFHANGSERLRITSDGKVGIGTSSPGSLLHVSGANVDTALKVQAGTAIPTIELLRGSNATFGGDVTYDYRLKNEAGNFTLQNGVNSTISDLVTVTGAGNVGIGTSAPSVTFEVASAADNTEYMRVGPLSSASTRALRFSAEASGGGAANTTHIINAPSVAGFLKFQTNSTTAVTIDKSQRVGIGTTSPGDLLHVYGGRLNVQTDTSFAGTDTPLIKAQTGPTGGSLFQIRAKNAADDNSDWELKTNANEELIFTVGTSESARIDSSGRLLVGTSTSITAPIFPVAPTTQYNAGIQRHAVGAEGSCVLGNWQTTNIPAALGFVKSSSNGVGTYGTALASGTRIAAITFSGDDSTKFVLGGTIEAFADAAWGVDDGPTRLVFSSTPSGSASPVERMRISSTGLVTVAGTLKATTFDIDSLPALP